MFLSLIIASRSVYAAMFYSATDEYQKHHMARRSQNFYRYHLGISCAGRYWKQQKTRALPAAPVKKI
jgi:hypothetical protein